MTKRELFENIKRKKSFLCIGLDIDVQKLPRNFVKNTADPIFDYNKQIIDATHQLCVAYKPNTAFYESMGAAGWEALEKTVDYIKQTAPDVFVIADAKRGDIGNTSDMYARAFFSGMNCDAVTVAPYMGEDSVSPFLAYEKKWAIILALTSNKGAYDFQTEKINDENLFETVLRKTQKWGTDNNTMYVVGATKAEMLTKIREIVPHHFLLVPGVGAQGGSLQDVAKHGITKECGLLVNASRSIIYASSNDDFADAAKAEAKKMQAEMEAILNKYQLA
jgi:orotidine-5'-phosphate decarboxylase